MNVIQTVKIRREISRFGKGLLYGITISLGLSTLAMSLSIPSTGILKMAGVGLGLATAATGVVGMVVHVVQKKQQDKSDRKYYSLDYMRFAIDQEIKNRTGDREDTSKQSLDNEDEFDDYYGFVRDDSTGENF